MTMTNSGFPLRSAVLALALASAAPLAWAEIFLCVDANGRKELTDTKRAGCKALTPPDAIPAPPARREGTRTPTATPSNFPRVDAATQKKRDVDRKALLESELRAERAKLEELKKAYANGEPERQGDEKNYQKYLDRVEAMKTDIDRVQKNIDMLNREIANIK